MINELKANQIFVFGSNQAGLHSGGAARYALEHFGAQIGVGEGITGQCYAFPTLDRDHNQRSVEGLMTSVDKFYLCAEANSGKQFLMSAVGTGIAGYTEHFMKSLFKNPPGNVVLPPEWT